MLENRACVNSLPAPKKRVPRQHHFIVYIYLLCWTQSYPALDHKDGGLGPKAGKELSPHSPPPLVTPGCLLRTSTGGAEGKHPKRREFCLSPTHKHNRLCMHAHTVNHTHAYTHIHTHQHNSSKSFEPFFPLSTKNFHGHKNNQDLASSGTSCTIKTDHGELVGVGGVKQFPEQITFVVWG